MCFSVYSKRFRILHLSIHDSKNLQWFHRKWFLSANVEAPVGTGFFLRLLFIYFFQNNFRFGDKLIYFNYNEQF